MIGVLTALRQGAREQVGDGSLSLASGEQRSLPMLFDVAYHREHYQNRHCRNRIWTGCGKHPVRVARVRCLWVPIGGTASANGSHKPPKDSKLMVHRVF
jgi:hypothetical protein